MDWRSGRSWPRWPAFGRLRATSTFGLSRPQGQAQPTSPAASSRHCGRVPVLPQGERTWISRTFLPVASIGIVPRVTIVPNVVTDSTVDSVPDSKADSQTSSAVPPAEASDLGASSEDPQSAAEADPEAASKAEIARLKDQLLRTLADFDNFRKRSRREISDAERVAREELLRELLPVFDNLERASQHAVGSTDFGSPATKPQQSTIPHSIENDDPSTDLSGTRAARMVLRLNRFRHSWPNGPGLAWNAWQPSDCPLIRPCTRPCNRLNLQICLQVPSPKNCWPATM